MMKIKEKISYDASRVREKVNTLKYTQSVLHTKAYSAGENILPEYYPTWGRAISQLQGRLNFLEKIKG